MSNHITAKKQEIAKRVLLPGDPLRAKWIAQKYLTNPKLVNEVRGMLAYTGKYKNVDVTIMGHGMGIPSIGIYTQELYSDYDVEVIYRIGSAGALTNQINIGDVIVVNSSWSYSNFGKEIGIKVKGHHLFPSGISLSNIIKTAVDLNIDVNIGRVASNDAFYHHKTYQQLTKWSNNAIAAEMESFGLFAVAEKNNRRSACLLTISDSIITGLGMTQIQREQSFEKMVTLALEAIIRE